jgi:hypothetical protein
MPQGNRKIVVVTFAQGVILYQHAKFHQNRTKKGRYCHPMLDSVGHRLLNIFTYAIVFPMVENPRNYI